MYVGASEALTRPWGPRGSVQYVSTWTRTQHASDMIVLCPHFVFSGHRPNSVSKKGKEYKPEEEEDLAQSRRRQEEEEEGDGQRR